MLSQAWFRRAVPRGARFDLGLYEMLLTVPLALASWRAKKPLGPRKPASWRGFSVVSR